MNWYLWVEPMANSVNTFMMKVYNWMIVALIVSWAIAYYVSINTQMFLPIFSSGLVYILFLVELWLVIAISWWINKISYSMALILFLLFSVVNWFTLSVIFLVYTLNSIFSVFFITASIFWFMSLYWYTTKADMTAFGSILYMWLFWLIIASLVNFFLKSSWFEYILSWGWVLIFTWLVAYDTNKIKELGMWLSEWDSLFWKMAIVWALSLYLDFINLFLYLLRLFWNRK